MIHMFPSIVSVHICQICISLELSFHSTVLGRGCVSFLHSAVSPQSRQASLQVHCAAYVHQVMEEPHGSQASLDMFEKERTLCRWVPLWWVLPTLRWVLTLDLFASGSGLTVQESIWISLESRLCKIGPQREGSGFSSPHSLGVSAEPPGYQ